jgi:hypothetical protein
MRNVQFEVPQQVIGDFCQKLLESGLNNTIVDYTDDGEIGVEVEYERGDEKTVDDLEEYLDELISEIEDEDDDDEEDED